MLLTLHTETTIDSCHYLRGYDGKCSERHGHTWFVEVWIQGDHTLADTTGILFDFGNIKQIKELYDHKEINGISPFDVTNPTAENLCYHIWKLLKVIDARLDYKVRIYETKIGKETWCECGDF